MIAGGFSEEDRRKAIMEKVQGQITRLNGLVSELLAFARPQDPKMSEVDLRSIAERVADLLPEGVEIRGQGRAMADPHRAHRVFRQLEGDLPFADMPFSVDQSTVIEKNGRWLHWDLRPDFDIDHRQVVLDGNDLAFDDGAFAKIAAAEAVFEHGGEIFAGRVQGLGVSGHSGSLSN